MGRVWKLNEKEAERAFRKWLFSHDFGSDFAKCEEEQAFLAGARWALDVGSFQADREQDDRILWEVTASDRDAEVAQGLNQTLQSIGLGYLRRYPKGDDDGDDPTWAEGFFTPLLVVVFCAVIGALAVLIVLRS